MEYLHFLETSSTGFYVIHDAGDELVNIPFVGVTTEQKVSKSKKHIHVLLEFKNPRSLSGFLKSFPVMRYYSDVTQKQFFTVYDIPYLNIPVQEVYKPLIEHAEIVSDVYALAVYFLHQDYKSIACGKKQYSIKDVKNLNCDVSYLSKYFNEYEITDAEILDIIYQIWYVSDSKQMFLQLISMHNNPKVLKYVQSHAYFIQKFIIEEKEVNIND